MQYLVQALLGEARFCVGKNTLAELIHGIELKKKANFAEIKNE